MELGSIISTGIQGNFFHLIPGEVRYRKELGTCIDGVYGSGLNIQMYCLIISSTYFVVRTMDRDDGSFIIDMW